MLRNGAEAACGTRRAAKWCPIFVRRCTIGVNAKLPADLSFFKLRFSSDAPRIEFAGGERGDNRGTKCPDPKALLDGIQQRFFICAWIFTAFQCACNGRFGMAVRIRRTAFARVFLVFLRLSVFAYASAYGAQPRAYRPGLPGWRAQKASVTLSFRRPSGRRNGRQSSYKQNAEDGVRLNEKRRTMERGEPRGTGCARAGRYAGAGRVAVWSRQRRAAHVVEPGPHDVARVGRHGILAVRLGIACRLLGVPSRMSLSRRFPVPDSWPVVAFAPILSHISRRFILTTLRSRTVMGVVRRFQADRRDVAGLAVHTVFRGKTSVGTAMRDS